MATGQIDLAKLFGTVAGTLAQNQTALNKADVRNGDHGDNMVDIFKVITQAMEQRQSADPADQLEYAAQLLRARKSGSAQLYAKGLAQASQQFQGKSVTQENALQLVQTLLGGGQAPAQPAGGDLASTLLSSLMGGGSQPAAGDDKLDASDLLSAGLAFMSSKQGGASNVEALTKALVSGSGIGSSQPYRAQSGELVANTLLQVIGSLTQK